jgi:CheY-like chemotaxis protein
MIALRKLKICVIDDDALVRDSTALGLSDWGYEVVVATNGMRGLEMVETAQPDVIVTDVVMPDGDAFELLPKLRARYPTLPVVAVSGGGQTGTKLYLELARQFGANECLTKPFSIEALSEAIERAFESHRAA